MESLCTKKSGRGGADGVLKSLLYAGPMFHLFFSKPVTIAEESCGRVGSSTGKTFALESSWTMENGSHASVVCRLVTPFSIGWVVRRNRRDHLG